MANRSLYVFEMGRSSSFPLFITKIFVSFLDISLHLLDRKWKLDLCNVKFRGFSDSYQKMGLTFHENTRDLEIFLHKLHLRRDCFLGVFTVSPVRR